MVELSLFAAKVLKDANTLEEQSLCILVKLKKHRALGVVPKPTPLVFLKVLFWLSHCFLLFCCPLCLCV